MAEPTYTGCTKKNWTDLKLLSILPNSHYYLVCYVYSLFGYLWGRIMKKISWTQILWTCVFSNKIKMVCARNLKVLIVFWVNVWTICWVFNYCKTFQTICFSLSPLTINFFLKNQSFACLINAFT